MVPPNDPGKDTASADGQRAVRVCVSSGEPLLAVDATITALFARRVQLRIPARSVVPASSRPVVAAEHLSPHTIRELLSVVETLTRRESARLQAENRRIRPTSPLRSSPYDVSVQLSVEAPSGELSGVIVTRGDSSATRLLKRGGFWTLGMPSERDVTSELSPTRQSLREICSAFWRRVCALRHRTTTSGGHS